MFSGVKRYRTTRPKWASLTAIESTLRKTMSFGNWSERFGISHDRLREVVAKVGP